MLQQQQQPSNRSDSTDSVVLPALQRVRAHFHQCPVVYSDDPLALPQPVFPITDFIASVSSQVVEDIAECFLETKFPQLDTPDVLFGVANRSVGCIVHELARRMELPYTLANWYPEGTLGGEVLVSAAPGFSGGGSIFVNGLRPGDRVAVVIDLLRSGKNLADLLRACDKAGAVVVGCYCVCEIVEHPGRNTVRGFFDQSCPLHVLVQVSARGERTKVIGTEGAAVVVISSAPPTAAINRLRVEDVMMTDPQQAFLKAKNLFSSLGGPNNNNNRAMLNPPLTRDEITHKLKLVAEAFYNIPVIKNEKLNYPYCFFQLTDFIPLMTYDVIENMADLCLKTANFSRCDVIVSEADRGGAPLAIALSRRTGKPFVLASWSTVVDSQVSDSTSVGFSGEGRFFITGVKSGERCIFVDDMLSSGGTAEGILGALKSCGCITLEAIFIGEKLTKPDTENGKILPVRSGFKRLSKAFPDCQISTLVQFTAYGVKTEPPVSSVG